MKAACAQSRVDHETFLPITPATQNVEHFSAARLVDGLSSALGGESIETLAARRDALLTTVVAATHGTTTQQ